MWGKQVQSPKSMNKSSGIPRQPGWWRAAGGQVPVEVGSDCGGPWS